MFYLIAINIVAFLLCYLDKRKAIHHKYRIPESFLITISLIGGCFGFIIGMHLFHHKTKKFKFKLVYLFCLIWLVVLYMYYLK